MGGKFLSDNAGIVSSRILQALSLINEGEEPAYGNDQYTKELSDKFSELFDRKCYAVPVATGTAANCISLAALSPRHGVVFCSDTSHILVDECGAPSFFNPGMKLVGVGGSAGKIDFDSLNGLLNDMSPGLFSGVPSVLSITQCTELGGVYSLGELEKLRQIAERFDVKVHIDGARLGNALATLDCSPAQLINAAGASSLALGLTKNGGMIAEVVVVFEDDLIDDFLFLTKQSGHLVSKQRYLSSQIHEFLKDDLWIELARKSNSAARKIAHNLSDHLLVPVDANEIFLKLSEDEKVAMSKAGFTFEDWKVGQHNGARFVTNWATTDLEIESLITTVKSLK